MSGPKRSKSSLFEYCQRRKIGPPHFETWAATNGYQAKVMIDGYPYPTSSVFSKKKDAENDAAKACLASMGIYEENEDTQYGQDEYNQQTGYNQQSGYNQQVGGQGYPSAWNSSFKTPTPQVGWNDGSSFATPTPYHRQKSNKSGGSGGGVKMPKSVLHEYCQSQKISLPQYEAEASYDGNTLLGFHCVLVVKDEYFTTDRLFNNKREAEHAVARKALNVFGYYARSPLYTGSTPSPKRSPAASPSFQTPETSYKNLLQEHLQQRGIETPDYETQLTDGGYFSKVTIEGKVYEAEECCQTKKLAEQAAAKAGLIGMGVKDPEAVAYKLLRRKPGGQYRGSIPYRKSLPEVSDSTDGRNKTWIHNRKQSGFDIDDFDDVDGEYADFDKAKPVQLKRSLDDSTEDDFFGEPSQRPTKMQRVGEDSENNSVTTSEKRPRRRGEYEVEEVHLGNMTVGEAWPEKRNIVIVGSEETSIPLVCQGDMERCALEDMTTGTLVDIKPGHRLVGLEGYYVVRGGQIVLRARQCKEVIMPEEPDKVLISCGVVVLHCIPRRNGSETACDVNVLLKRYLCSQAFINVVRGLAQYFRCKVTDRPHVMNKDLLVVNIQDWMLEEVMAISSFSETALENVFQHTMKFEKRWVKYLKNDEMSPELRAVQAAANDELFRRANSGEDQNQDRFRPWRLPKGNFYHRILTTGVFIESPAEAAMRELKEETGIKLKLNDISSSPYVDLPQSDNLNPHKGDMARYYLCGIITEAESDEKEEAAEEEPSEEATDVNPDHSTTPATCAASTITGSTPTQADASWGTNIAPAYSAWTSTNPAGSADVYSSWANSNTVYQATAAAFPTTYPTDPNVPTAAAYPNAGSTSSGWPATNTAWPGTYSAAAGTDPATAAVYAAWASTNPSLAAANPSMAGTNPAMVGTNPALVGTNPAITGTSPAVAGTNLSWPNAYSASATYPAQVGTYSYPGTTGTYADPTNAYSPQTAKYPASGAYAGTGPYPITAATYSAAQSAYLASTTTSSASASTTGATPGTYAITAATYSAAESAYLAASAAASSVSTSASTNPITAATYSAAVSSQSLVSTTMNSTETTSRLTGAASALTYLAAAGALPETTEKGTSSADAGGSTRTPTASALTYLAAAGAFSDATDSASTKTNSSRPGTASALTYLAAAGAFSAATDPNAASTETKTISASTDTISAALHPYSATAGAYSVAADAYSAQSDKDSTAATESKQTGIPFLTDSPVKEKHSATTNSTTPSAKSDLANNNSSPADTNLDHATAVDVIPSKSELAAGIPFLNDSPGKNTDSASVSQASTSDSKESASGSTDKVSAILKLASANVKTSSASVGQASDMATTPSTQTETSEINVQSESAAKKDAHEESSVILSPIVAGAVHEECRWFHMEEAIEISTIFAEIHRSPEFQKLLAKLKGIVSAM